MDVERLGKYELLSHLATGGMASVYLARVTGLGGFERHVVLKTLRAEGLEDPSFVGMFLDEARLVATLHHQHVAQVYEVGVTDGTYFLAMEYLHGATVRDVLETAHERGVRLPLELSLSIVCAAAAGLHHAHEQRGSDGAPLRIVHRDVSPSNVMIAYDGSVKLIDFGIAKAEARTIVTQVGFIKGKAGYMAPEQALGYEVDRRSDVFALGVLAYELTTQRRAFHGESMFESMQRSIRGDLLLPSRVVPGFSEALEAVISTALEPDPDDRFQDADELRRAFVQTAKHLGLELGAAPVSAILDELYGRRPEPWLAALPSHDPADEVTRVDDDTPVIDQIRIARGTLSPAPLRTVEDEITTPIHVPHELHTPPERLAPAPPMVLRSLPIAYAAPPTVVVPEPRPARRRLVVVVALALAAVIGALVAVLIAWAVGLDASGR